jgi:glycosyltransferase involved in cell wall biosynthesis
VRVLFAITNGDVGGAQEHLRIIAEGLLARSHRVGLLVARPSPLADRLGSTGVEILPWGSIVRHPQPISDWKARRQLVAAVRHFRPDVLHVHSAKAGVLGRGVLSPPAGVTIYTCHHAPYGPGRKISHRLLGRPLEAISLPMTNGIISVGARDMPMMRKLAPGVPMFLVRNAVPPQPLPASSDQTTAPVAVWVARLAHPKDPLQAIDAWRHVVARVPAARLLICGTGPLSERVQRAAEKSPVRAQISYLGHVPDLSAVLAQGSIYLLASQVEGGTTMATLEAMTAGLVPVLNDVGDAFLYTHADCGIVVSRNAPRALASAVVDLFQDPARLRDMSRRAATFARESWTVDDMVEGTVHAYRSTLAHHGIDPTD